MLDFEGLTVSFATRTGWANAVDDVSLEVAPGRTTAVIGESGSGKSMIAKTAMGLLPASARIAGGRLLYEGRDLLRLKPKEWRAVRGEEIALIPQDPLRALNPVHTIGRQIAEGLVRTRHLSRGAARARAVELLHGVRIPQPEKRLDAFPHELSGGMRQRVMIAMAMALEPRIIFADEPTTALDVTVQAQVLDLLKSLQKDTGRALVIISHDLGVVASVADRVVVLYAGTVMERGPAREVCRTPANPYSRGLLRSIPSARRKLARLEPIRGAPASLSNRPGGCPFRTRCDLAQEICAAERPPEVTVAPGRSSRCHFAAEVFEAGFARTAA